MISLFIQFIYFIIITFCLMPVLYTLFDELIYARKVTILILISCIYNLNIDIKSNFFSF